MAMGTRFELVLSIREEGCPDGGRSFSCGNHLRAIADLVIAEIDEWHRRLTRFEADSWVSHVNRTAAHEPVRCDDDLWALMADASDVWKASDGAFDVTRGHGEALLLDQNTRTIRFARADVAIDLGAIGKGHAIDCCVRLLRAYGVTSAFIHGGTSSGAAIGVGPDGQPWRVKTTSEVKSTSEVVSDSAFSVSDAAGQSRPHISDRSGALIETGRAVVIGPSARLADAWSTALVVLGRVPSSFPSDYTARIT